MPHRLRPWTGLTLATAMLLLTTACGGADDGSGPAHPTPGPVQSSPPAVTVKQADVTVPSKVGNNPDKRSAVSVTSCKATADGWMAAGTATATKSGPETFTITVFFTTEQATVVEWGKTTVTARAGATATWQIAKRLPVRSTLLCPLRGVA